MTSYQKVFTSFFILKHKLLVFWYIIKFCRVLIIRGLKHDNSKFSKEEFEYVYLLSKNDKTIKFGTQEYYDLVDSIGPAKRAHFIRNRHHVEFHNSIKDMNLIDLIECLADWLAATKRKSGDIYNSIDINKEKYKIGEKTKNRLISTIKEIEK